MTNRISRTARALGCLAAVAIAALTIGRLGAQDHPPEAFTGNKVAPLVRMELTGVPDREVIANIYEVPAGAMVPRHFHHGDEFHLVLSGEWAAEVEGKPTHVMKAGDAQYVGREKWHGGRVVSSQPLRLLGVMIVEKGKPIIEMAR
jgi:quercetin dioxygenase-like cupin family protein